MPRYKAVLLDLDGTVYDFPAAERAAFLEVAAALGLENAETLYQAYHLVNDRMWAQLERGEITREELKSGRFQQTLEPAGFSFNWSQVNLLYEERLGCHAPLYPGALELCRYLAERYTVVAVTNGLSRAQRGRLAVSGIRPYLRGMAVSEEVGQSKPEPGVFQRGLELAGNPAKSETILLGDGYTADILGGFHFGVDTIWYNPEKKTGGLVRPTYETATYEQVRRIL